MQLRPVSFQTYTAPASAAPAVDQLALQLLDGDKSELARLQRLAPAGASLADLARFYKLGAGQSDEKLSGSLQWVQRGLTSEGGHLGRLEVDERVEVLLTLLKAHPAARGTPFESRFPGGPLSQLAKETNRFMDADELCQLGSAMYKVPLQPPRRPVGLVQLARDYAGALERMRGAPSRVAKEMQPEDEEWALSCIRIEQSHLHQEPSRVALFRKLVGMFQDPAIAHVVMMEAQSLPLSKQDSYLKTLSSELLAVGTHDSDWELTRAQGAVVQKLAAGVQTVMKVARPTDNPSSLLAELRALAGKSTDEGLERGAHWRGPGESWAQGLQNDPFTGLEPEKDHSLAEAVFSRSQKRGEDFMGLVAEVKGMSFRLHEAEYLGVLVHALSLDEPLGSGLARMTREYDLTGKTNGLSPVRAQVAEALASGAVKGDLETLMKRFELIYVQRTTSGGEAKDKALSTALAELLDVASPGRSGVVQTGGAIWVNGVRLRKAGSS